MHLLAFFSTTASTIVYVAHGAVTAAIANGTSRSISVNEILNLDASISTDADQLPLNYQVIDIQTAQGCCSFLFFFSYIITSHLNESLRIFHLLKFDPI